MCVHNNMSGKDCSQCFRLKAAATLGTSAIIGAQGAIVRKTTGLPFYPSLFSALWNAPKLVKGPPQVIGASLILGGMGYMLGKTTGFSSSAINKAKEELPGYIKKQ